VARVHTRAGPQATPKELINRNSGNPPRLFPAVVAIVGRGEDGSQPLEGRLDTGQVAGGDVGPAVEPQGPGRVVKRLGHPATRLDLFEFIPPAVLAEVPPGDPPVRLEPTT